MNCSTDAAIHVVAAILRDPGGRLLLTRRPDHLHQGGLWEFPGGKVETGEGAAAALRRELHEELGITALASRPFMTVEHRYPDKAVRLEIREVEWSGDPYPREGQELRWQTVEECDPEAFPAADRPVLTALRLPPCYVISDEPHDEESFMDRLESCLARGERLIQLRARGFDDGSLGRLARRATVRCRESGAVLMVNAPAEVARRWDIDGIHLTARQLMSAVERPLPAGRWVAASCHDRREMDAARRLGVDFVTLSPLRSTVSHPGAVVLGWERFAPLALTAGLPVYALGGVTGDDLAAVRRAGGWGVAGIGAFWGREGPGPGF